jgi:CO dehydrogenase maturation factor
MKIAVTGKGGVGKTTLVALFARTLRDSGKTVIVIDADPDMNLSRLMGIPLNEQPVPIIELKELIAERTGTELGRSSPIFKMNPKVSDIPEKYWVDHEGIKVMVMGGIKGGGLGCACPENAFLKSLISYILIIRNEWVILDMEAGIEHLGRGTAQGVDEMIVVVEPNQSSLETAHRIKKLAGELGMKKIEVILNKIHDKTEEKYITDGLKDIPVLGKVDYSAEMRKIDLGQETALTLSGISLAQVEAAAKNAGWI